MLEIPEVKDNIKIYEEVIDKLSQLFIKLGISKDPVKIYETFRYMYINGYLSSNGRYSDIIPLEMINLELDGFIKMDVTGMFLLYGYGVCRHTSDFLRHIYSTLGFDSSQLFTYHPSLQIIVENKSKKFLTNLEAQKYIDDALYGFDLFSKEEVHFTKNFENIVVHVNYLPEKGISLNNHTMNIVRDNDGLVHILDTRYHSVGERIDEDRIRLSYQGLIHIDFIQKKDLSFHTVYGTNYYKGLVLLDGNTDIDKDVLRSIVSGESCKEHISDYEEFLKMNLKSYNRVSDNIKRLAKRL